MGAIEPFLAQNHVKQKSEFTELTSYYPHSRRRPIMRHRHYGCDDMLSLPVDHNSSSADNRRKPASCNNEVEGTSLPAILLSPSTLSSTSLSAGTPSPTTSEQHQKSKKISTLSPVGGCSLKPSVSTSCLLTADESNASSTLVCIPTRASLTHEWKKLKTPNKCRECNLLVYFNGRECSFCGYVAHKKCVAILVIKCSGQHVAGIAKSNNNSIRTVQQSKQQPESQTSNTNTNRNNLNQSQRNKIKPPIKPIFGQPLTNDSAQVIDFMRRFIYEIDTRGLTLKGIYRVSSIKSKVDKLCNYYDQNLSNLVDLSSFHPNIIANALKMYLRQLPEPLLTNRLYNKFIEVAKMYSSSTVTSSASVIPLNTSLFNLKNRSTTLQQTQPSRFMSTYRHRKPYSLPVLSITTSPSNNPAYNPMLIVELREIIDLMPPINRRLVAIIMRHLKRVSDMSEENQMSAKNLSIIFGPTLMNAVDNKSLAIVDNIHQARLVELMITWADQIFPQYANYESTAVIELDFSEEEHREQERLKEEKDGKVGEQEFKNKSSDNKTEFITNNDLVMAQSNKTRNDLKELRRQFFTPTNTPQVTINQAQLPEISKITTHADKRKSKSSKPPGSVPVIKVQPYYCNTLTNNGSTSEQLNE